MMTSNKVVFFDVFDTLVTPNRGYLEPHFTREIDRMGDIGQLRTAEQTIAAIADVAIQNGNVQFFADHSPQEMARYYETCMSKSIKNVDTSVLQMLSTLKANGCRLCAVSDAACVDIADWQNSPLAAYFDDTVFSCDVGHIKPDVELFEIAKRRMGNPQQCIFVGDGGHDELQGARMSGMRTVKAEWLKCRDDETIYANADYVVKTPDRLQFVVNNVSFGKKSARRLPSMGEDLLQQAESQQQNESVGDFGSD